MATNAFDPASELAPSSYKSVFDETVPTIAVVVRPKTSTGIVLSKLRGWVLARRGVRAVWDDGVEAKTIYLCPDALRRAGFDSRSDTVNLEQLPPPVVIAINEAIAAAQSGRDAGRVTLISFRPVTFSLDSSCFTMEEILARLLPRGIVIPSGFEQVGHIAHMNLQDSQLPFKRLIGQVLLDCNRIAGVRTVVHKLEIASQFRELKLELLAGDDDFVAKVRQHGIEFTVPFDKVYWNSKLSREHERLVGDHMRRGDFLFDVMAGIGPFVIPALRIGVSAWGNDLNPASVESLIVNVKNNTTIDQASHFVPSCEDGRSFIRRVRAEILSRGPLLSTAPPGNVNRPPTRHFVMNLPALAVSFLNVFGEEEWRDEPAKGVTYDRSFRVHCYCFSKTSDATAAADDAVAQCETNLGFTLRKERDIHQVHVVRDVAPNKLMVCVSFSLPDEVFEGRQAARAQPRKVID